MHLPESWIVYFAYIFDAITLKSWTDGQLPQKTFDTPFSVENTFGISPVEPEINIPRGPIYTPPYVPGDEPPPDVAIECQYPDMKGWEMCNSPSDRGCWLRKEGELPFDITSNYERRWPKGRTRRYTLDVSEMALAPDGKAMLHGKVFNGSYPGPWIQACWGDEIEITVRNHLWYNGTTIHWHGIRQWNTPEMDGVNAVTQCPIAPGQEFTYKFTAMQYGSSWYHSHYSLQYADGLAGPMTIYGPSSDEYDYAVDPLLMTDWNHRSAFEDWAYNWDKGGSIPKMTNILFNGKGRYKSPDPKKPIGQPERYTKVVQKGKRYLLRLINTSLDSTFVFAIDGHNLTVVGADFVPIEPYSTSKIVVGIGQRYHAILTANPIESAPENNYWMRAIPAKGCGGFVTPPDDRVGVLRYNAENSDDPESRLREFSIQCADEPYENLKPILKWKVGEPSNLNMANDTYDVGLMRLGGKPPWHPVSDKPRWNADRVPMWLNFSHPTILDTEPEGGIWPDYYDIVTQNHDEDAWIYLIITGNPKAPKNPGIQFVSAAHPMHLHGHDFALLYQSAPQEQYPGSYDLIKSKLKLDNPPRRDVVLLPAKGYVVIAFKADNPGPWLLHCHIAWHASSGLGFQILENRHKMNISAESHDAMLDTCIEWDKWVSDMDNLWNKEDFKEFQDDSGV